MLDDSTFLGVKFLSQDEFNSAYCTTMLYVKKSKLPNAGKGLWTSSEIKKDEVVCEYEGAKITWKECLKRNENQKGFGAYYFYVNSKNCIEIGRAHV